LYGEFGAKGDLAFQIVDRLARLARVAVHVNPPADSAI
jgi:hypothetical protein